MKTHDYLTAVACSLILWQLIGCQPASDESKDTGTEVTVTVAQSVDEPAPTATPETVKEDPLLGE